LELEAQFQFMARLNRSQSLRAIGEDLEQRGIKAFDIRCEEDYYIVQAGYQAAPNPMPVSLHYSMEDIRQLDREQREKRNQPPEGHDFLKLSLILRSIAGYVGRKKGRLIRISNNYGRGTDASFRIEYVNAENEIIIDERSVAAIYDICVSQYKLRGTALPAGGKYFSLAAGLSQERGGFRKMRL
jgi:hypothetical protein